MALLDLQGMEISEAPSGAFKPHESKGKGCDGKKKGSGLSLLLCG